MALVRNLLSYKPSAVWTVRSSDSVLDALRVMAEKNIGAVLVLDPQGALAGIFSERDYARKVVLQGKRSADTRVGDVMTSELRCVDPDTRIDTCMEMMTHERVRHLPVLDQGRILGVVSIGDIVKAIIQQQERTIADLQHYITGAAGV